MGRILRRLGVMLSALVIISGLAPASAAAKVGLLPGTPLYFKGGGSCSLGFLASNDRGDRLAVTAGHCAKGTGQAVVSAKGNPIGEVVSWLNDDMDNSRWGVTLIYLSKNTYTADAYFVTYGNPSVGDGVKKYGKRTDKTEGKITKVSIDSDSPSHSRMESTLVGLEGDSGSAWVGGDDNGNPKLLGLNIGYTHRADGGYGYAIGYPIRQLIKSVRNGSAKWGAGFTPVGP